MLTLDWKWLEGTSWTWGAKLHGDKLQSKCWLQSRAFLGQRPAVWMTWISNFSEVWIIRKRIRSRKLKRTRLGREASSIPDMIILNWLRIEILKYQNGPKVPKKLHMRPSVREVRQERLGIGEADTFGVERPLREWLHHSGQTSACLLFKVQPTDGRRTAMPRSPAKTWKGTQA